MNSISKIFILLCASWFILNCNIEHPSHENIEKISDTTIEILEEEIPEHIKPNPLISIYFADTINFTNVAKLTTEVLFDIKYATADNFTGKIIYDCPACFMQTNAAIAIVKAGEIAKAKGYQLKAFDCYRPQEYQYRLWEAFPNINYVAPPEKKSMHSYGCAIDLTLVDSLGNELNMGTEFDSFLKTSYTFSTEIDEEAKANRAILIEIMEAAGFRPIKTEWWHFYFVACNKSVNNALKWECENN